MPHLTTVERDYQTAKVRLMNAQQEKLEATVEFLSARAALRRSLETLWPSPSEAAPFRSEWAEIRECAPELGYDEAAYGKHKTR